MNRIDRLIAAAKNCVGHDAPIFFIIPSKNGYECRDTDGTHTFNTRVAAKRYISERYTDEAICFDVRPASEWVKDDD
jgi:hypothetical protein